jgi:hypothetical protein
MSKNQIVILLFRRIPKLFSVIFHPLLMPTLGIYVILTSGTNASLLDSEAKNIILTLVMACTFIIPLAFVPFYYYWRITTSLTMSERQERIVPLAITGTLYYVCFFILHQMGAPRIILAFLFATALTVIINLLVTLRWKISAHMTGIGGVIGLIFSMAVLYHVDTMFYLMISILLSGFIGFARLSLNAHTPSEVYWGFINGFAVMVATFFVF